MLVCLSLNAVLVCVLLLASSTAGQWHTETAVGMRGANARATLASEHTLPFPWLQSHAPVQQPADQQAPPPYAGLQNDLVQLLNLRKNSDGWVTVFTLSMGRRLPGQDAIFLRLALNTVATYMLWGRADFHVIAALDYKALSTCMALRLPCLNATHHADEASSSYRGVNWSKMRLLRDVLKAGFNVHLSDTDVAYLKDVQASVAALMAHSCGTADGSFMEEEAVEWVQQEGDSKEERHVLWVANNGVTFLKATPRSIALVERILEFDGTFNGIAFNEQFILSCLMHESWADCHSEATCRVARDHALAAITRHPRQYQHGVCLPESHFDPCDGRRLYTHAICKFTYVEKLELLQKLRLVLVQDEAGNVDPAVLGSGGPLCPPGRQVAWAEHRCPDHARTRGVAAGRRSLRSSNNLGPGFQGADEEPAAGALELRGRHHEWLYLAHQPRRAAAESQDTAQPVVEVVDHADKTLLRCPEATRSKAAVGMSATLYAHKRLGGLRAAALSGVHDTAHGATAARHA